MAKILVVDDEYLLATMLADILEDEGHDVAMASNGQAALVAIRQSLPDLVVTDFMMPVMTGLEFADAVRADTALAHIPIILVSGAQGGIARERPELSQAVHDKPYRHDELVWEIAAPLLVLP